MTVLITSGTLNQYTFANSIVAANEKSKVLFGGPVVRVDVFHSAESEKKIQSLRLSEDEYTWDNAIEDNGLSDSIVRHRVVEINSSKESIELFVENLEEIIYSATAKNTNVVLDLSNGTTLNKNLLSTAAYVLDIQHQYVLDIGKLFKLTDHRGFISADLLVKSYVSAPDSTALDSIAHLSLSEVLRYKKIIKTHSRKFEDIAGEYADTSFFANNLDRLIRLKLRADQKKDNTIYKIVSASISNSAEDLISHLVERFSEDSKARMLGEKLSDIRTKVEEKAPAGFDIEFFRKFNDFVLYLRNSSTHKGGFLTDVEKFKADLSVKMAFPFIEFYTDVVFDILSETSKENILPKRIQELKSSMPEKNEIMYYGLDGDNTGKVLEELFFAAKKPEHFKKISNSVKNSIAQIRNDIKKGSNRGSVIFEAGDDLLFTGCYDLAELEKFQGMYSSGTSGLTCSIGYGTSFQEVYLALKMAKARPSKGAIVGAKYKVDSAT